MTEAEFSRLLTELLAYGRETPWLEMKANNVNEQQIGEYVSALSNAAAIHDRSEGYLVWGVEDRTHRLIGTEFDPERARIGNQPLLIHLSANLDPGVRVDPLQGVVHGKRVVVMRVQAAPTVPVGYKGERFIRVGESKTLLRNHPEVERALWAKLDRTPFEVRAVRARLDEAAVLPELDYPSYFDLLKVPLPENRGAILERLNADRLVRKEPEGWSITNLGALLLAKSLTQWEGLGRKAIRVVVYRGNDRSEILRQRVGDKGYAADFQGLLRWINDQLPENEHIGDALRTTTRMYPEVALREVVANALIHQDFSVTGAGPMVEVFRNRVEVLNPGRPIIDPSRLDLPPRSRNELMAGLTRRMRMCEELGSGIDRVLTAVEAFQLPAPEFATPGESTRVTLFAYRTFAEMDRKERSRAAYQHAGLMHLTGSSMTNASLRKRFGIDDDEYTKVSGVIRDALDEGLIFHDPPDSTARKTAKYVPFWASPAWKGGTL
ncbi:MAG TPA: ATP-binding protein [Phycisphaerales bacterium]|nr:ATP-binding protein [Phycisphaerales bacterium]